MSDRGVTTGCIEIDGREMQPPDPLEHTLAALDRLSIGDEVLLKVFCHPRPLFDILRKHGFVWTNRPGGRHARGAYPPRRRRPILIPPRPLT